MSSDITEEDAYTLSKVNEGCLVFYTAEAVRSWKGGNYDSDMTSYLSSLNEIGPPHNR